MKTLTRFLTSIAIAIAFVGCGGGDTHQKIADDMIKGMDRMVTALSTVTDKASAEKAMVEMKSITADMKAVAERGKKLGEPAAEVKTKLEADMKAKTEDMQKKMMGSMLKLATAGPEAMKIVQDGLTEFGKVMQEASK